jgi:exonuclease SbcC
MSAFGSYASEETVDFTDVNHGIFLITGDTGAGKTTIFDAITYAFYDQTSGGKRDGEMMRSQFADDDIRTFVELKFIYNGETYIISRSPRQERISKRKNKDGDYTKTVDQPSVELIMPDGMPYRGKIKETNQKIIDIIGLDINQFTQIAMIAQGDFLKLLHAPSKERKEIFAKIFNTRIYWRIEEELKNSAKSIYIKLEDNRKDVLREMENVQCIDGSTYEAEWNTIPRFSESNPDKLISMVQQIIDEAKQKEADVTKEQSENQSALNMVITELKQAEETNKLFNALEKEQNRKVLLDSKAAEMESVRNRKDSAKKAAVVEPKEKAYLNKRGERESCDQRIVDIKEWLEKSKAILEGRRQRSEAAEAEYKRLNPELAAKISKINDFLPKYQLLEEMNSDFEAISRNKQLTQDELNAICENINNISETQIKLNSDQQILKSAAESLQLLTQSVERLSDKKVSLDNLLSVMQTLQKYRKVYQEAEQECNLAEVAAHEKSERYDSIYQLFIEGQAGILAHELKEGCACPVCGSTSHPQIASFTEIGISQKDLQNAKSEKEIAEKGLENKKNAMLQAKQSYENQKVKAELEGKRSIGPEFDVDQTAIDDIKVIITDCAEQFKAETEKKNSAEAAKQSYERNETKLKQLKENLEANLQKKELSAVALKAVEIKLAEVSANIKNMKASLLYETKQAAEEELAASMAQTQNLETAVADSSKSYQAILEETNQKQGNLKTEETGLIRLSEEETKLQEDFNQELLIQGFADLLTFHASLLSAIQIEELDQSYQRYREEVIQVESSLKHFMDQTVGKSKVQTISIEEKKIELEAAKSQQDELAKSVFGIRSRNERVIENIEKFYDAREKMKSEYAIINRLEATATGKAGQKRLNFQTYIQRRYFNSILNEANKRLFIMSNGQFILKCRNMEDLSNQGEVGLDLDVYSMVNDQTRDVKTLSGGESFMAALAMALGMADIIQNTAGSIHIDTMFIDEGFGSLSDETRMQAINILNGLSEGKRLVGIISHVTELKAQIGTKLVVTKNDKGSKVKWEIGE